MLGSSIQGVQGGSWVVISGVIRKVTIVIPILGDLSPYL